MAITRIGVCIARPYLRLCVWLVGNEVFISDRHLAPFPYGLGGRGLSVMPVSWVATLLNRVLMPLPSAVAPTATASAMKTRSIAYSVAVAPRASLRKRLIRLSISISF